MDAAHAAALAAGGTQVSAPADMPWGQRVAEIRDPDGNLVALGATTSEAAAGAGAT